MLKLQHIKYYRFMHKQTNDIYIPNQTTIYKYIKHHISFTTFFLFALQSHSILS